MKYKQRQECEGFEVPMEELYRLVCCDCGLVHDVVWVVEDGKLTMAAKRNNRATGQRRRKPQAYIPVSDTLEKLLDKALDEIIAKS